MSHTDPGKRHEFVLLFDVKSGNPNGDPDAGNLPRVDPETMHGLVTDVALKRKVRDYVALTRQQTGSPEDGFAIFIQSKTALNTLYFDALYQGAEAPSVSVEEDEDLFAYLEALGEDFEFDPEAVKLKYLGESRKEKDLLNVLKGEFNIEKPEKKEKLEKKLKELAKSLAEAIKNLPKVTPKQREDARQEMMRRYYDIRVFGAVLTGGTNAGQVRGPVQFTFARSINPILPLDLSITRVAITKESDRRRKTTEMGRKPLVPYGLYRAHGFFNPFLAKSTGVTREDLAALWEALQNLFDFDRSAARGEMAVRGLCVFTHENSKGNAAPHKLFELVRVKKRDDVESPRSYSDYEVAVDRANLPTGVTLTCLIKP